MFQREAQQYLESKVLAWRRRFPPFELSAFRKQGVHGPRVDPQSQGRFGFAQ